MNIYINDLYKLDDIYDDVSTSFVNIIQSDTDNDSVCLSTSDEIDIIEEITNNVFDKIKKNIKIYHDYKYRNFIIQFIEDELDNVIEEYHLSMDDEMMNNYKNAIIQQIEYVIPVRSQPNNKIVYNIDKAILDEKLSIINEKDQKQPTQRTQEWYIRRYNLLSASTGWKCLDSQSNKNAIILEKCRPLNVEKYNYVNINSPFHWGQKYEPVSQMYYEYMYNTKIKEYGCIPHSKYGYLGASPDGIVVNRENDRYGRMLEIKNIVNRDITGEPKKEYWIQMQLQMECCDLNECDFLETRFKEYNSYEEFINDGTFQFTWKNKYKGIIMQFYIDNKPYYHYAPFNCSEVQYHTWRESIMDRYKNNTWIKDIYWYLDEISCVLVERNPLWFSQVQPEFEEIWNIIKEERIEGYTHREPKKRKNKYNNVIKVDSQKEVNHIDDLHKQLIISIDI